MTEQDPNIRAGDADREAVAERLRRHHSEGRLDVQEFQDRIDHCYQAKTLVELEALVDDLPRERPPEPDPASRRPFLAGRPPWVPFVPFLPILATILLLSAIGHHGHHPWFGVLIPLLWFTTFMVWRRGRGIRRLYRRFRRPA
jgi:hypothetical protein